MMASEHTCDSVESCNARLVRCGKVKTKFRTVKMTDGESLQALCTIIIDAPEWVTVEEYVDHRRVVNVYWVGSSVKAGSDVETASLEPDRTQCQSVARELPPCPEGGPEYPRVCLEENCMEAGYMGSGEEKGRCTILKGHTYHKFSLSLYGCAHWCIANVPRRECPENEDNRPPCVDRERPKAQYLAGPNQVCVVTTKHPTTHSTFYGVPWALSCARLGWRDAIPDCWEQDRE